KPADAKAAGGDAKAAGGDKKPAGGDAKPADGDKKPEGGDAKPAEGGSDTKPAGGGDAKPAEGGDAKPAEGDSGLGPNCKMLGEALEKMGASPADASAKVVCDDPDMKKAMTRTASTPDEEKKCKEDYAFAAPK